MTEAKLEMIMDSLDTVQENLLSMPDDLLLRIDPRDNDSLKTGLEFIMEYNSDLQQFSVIADRLRLKINKYFNIRPETEEIEGNSFPESGDQVAEKQRIIAALDIGEPHSIRESFTYKRPYGFILDDAAFKGIKTWKSLYFLVLKVLEKKDPVKFRTLPHNEAFMSSRGNPAFSVSADNLRIGEKGDFPFFIEINLSADYICKNIAALLEYYSIPEEKLKVYLREDRNAGE